MSSIEVEEVIFTQPAGYNVGTSTSRVEAPVIDAENTLVQGISYLTADLFIEPVISTYYTFLTVPAPSAGVALPPITQQNIGQSVMIFNTSADDALVYPFALGDTVDGGADYTLTAGSTIIFLNDTISSWITLNLTTAIPGIIVGANCNTFVGNNAGNITLTGTDNTEMGCDVLPGVTTGIGISAYGSHACNGMIDGQYVVAVGYHAMELATNLSGDIAIGYQALQNSDGPGAEPDVAIGFNALNATTAPSGSVAIGSESQVVINVANARNVSVGFQTMASGTNVTESVAIGYGAMTSAVNATACVFVGYQAGNASNVNEVTAVGYRALAVSVGDAGNTAFGVLALADHNGGADNTAVGWNALATDTTGANNTAIGSGAMAVTIAVSDNNTCVGAFAGNQLGAGGSQVAVGYQALQQNGGSNNTAVGNLAMSGTVGSAGSRNTAVGSLSMSCANVTGTEIVAIGYNTCANLDVGVGELVAVGARA